MSVHVPALGPSPSPLLGDFLGTSTPARNWRFSPPTRSFSRLIFRAEYFLAKPFLGESRGIARHEGFLRFRDSRGLTAQVSANYKPFSITLFSFRTPYELATALWDSGSGARTLSPELSSRSYTGDWEGHQSGFDSRLSSL